MPDAVSLPEHFRKNGYFTARTGKIFHGSLDDGPSWSEGGEPATGDRPPRTPQQAAEYRRTSDRWVATEKEDDQPDFKTASRAIELLEAHKEKPFFIAVGFNKPHSPLIAPKKYFDLYDAAEIPLPPDFAARPHALPGAPEIAIPRGAVDLFIDRDATAAEAREMIRAYYACVSFVDAQVGRVLAKLDELKLRDRTVIVFWGDHGYHLGEKGKWSKHGSLYEVATRAPLMIHAPGVSANGHAAPRTVESVDIYPTLAELCALPQLAGLEGNSLVPLLKNPAAPWSHPAFSVLPKGKTVRTERWRYTEWDNGKGSIELYDEQADPHELKNLANEARYAETVTEMKRLLRGDWKRVQSLPEQKPDAEPQTARTSPSEVVREEIEWLNMWLPGNSVKDLPRVLLIGDSITQGYYQEVADRLKGRAVVARLTTSKSAGDDGLLAEVKLVLAQNRFDVVHFNNGLH
ncbi:MAG: sulfatase, partial [Terriglobales bacterium]